ncbi:MAG: SLBB domain-containing protein [Gemmatimonadales bacterium]
MRFFGLLWLTFGLTAGAAVAQRPSPDQVRAVLQSRPELAAQLRDRIATSGLTPDQIRSRLAASGYAANLLDAYLDATTAANDRLTEPSGRMLEAVRALGLASPDEVAFAADSVAGEPGDLRDDLPEKKAGPEVFGLEVFRRVSTQFQPSVSGPVDRGYRLGPSDVLVLILTGDVELAHTLEVTREGFVVIPQVGQVYVAGLTLEQLDIALRTRLGRVYSGIARDGTGSTRFQISVARLRTNQIFVVGEVVRPGSYQVSSVGTVLTALYLAGGPTESGSFRQVEVRRGGRLVDSLDLYRYLLRGENGQDARLEHGDIVFVPVRKVAVEIEGAVVRPAIYELRATESLRDLVAAAGGFAANALRRRIQIDRILPPEQRAAGGRDRVVIELAETQIVGDSAPAFPLVPGDRVSVFSIAERRRNAIAVRGNVWVEGRVGFSPGMRLSDAIRLAGGPKADAYLGQISISRLNPDSTRIQLRSAFADSTGRVTDDLALTEDDEITVFSRTAFRPDRYVVISGAVGHAGRIRYKEGMTLRDAVLEASGVTEDAMLTEVEIARLPEDRSNGAIASTFRAPLDSTYLFDRGRRGEYLGPPGLAAPGSGAPEVRLHPYDNVLVFRQPDWELQRSVQLTGQVRFPGRYALRSKTERLADLIDRAGGLTKEAYARGAELYRQVPGDSSSGLRLVGQVEARRTGGTETSKTGVDSLRLGTSLAQRVGLDLVRALSRPQSHENLLLQSGDSVVVPEFNPTVRVLGAVNAPATVVYREGWGIDRYINAAGGFSRLADKGRAYVVQPGGGLESINRRFLLPDSKPKPLPGAVVVIPDRDPTDKRDWAGFLGSVAQILASTVAIIVVATR